MKEMNDSILHEELVLLDFEASSKEDLLVRLGEVLVAKGYVKPSYIEGVLERERNYPTGLKTEGVQVAIPHTDAIHVNKPAVLVAKLKTPVVFNEMGNDSNEVEAKIIFMIAMKKAHEQLDMLGSLMEVFSNTEKLMRLDNSNDRSEVIKLLSN